MAEIIGSTLSSPYGTKPTSLTTPVPGVQAQDEADSLMAELSATTQLPQQLDEADALMAELDSGSFAQPEEIEQDFSPEEIIAAQNDNFPIQEPNTTLFGTINTDIRQQLADAPLRVAANIAGNPASVKLTLEKNLGAHNVKSRGGKFYVRREGEKAFRPLDPGTLDIIGDLYADNYKEVLQVAGGVAGGMAGAPAGPIGAVGGAAMGVAAATAGVNAIGESRYGVVRDASRSNSQDPGFMGQIIRATDRTAEALQTGAEYVMLDRGMSGVISKVGAKIASRKAGSKSLLATEEIRETADLIQRNADELAAEGIELRQGKLVMSPGQVAGDLSPEVKGLDKSLTTEGPVRDFFIKQGQLIESGWNKIKQGIVNVTGKSEDEIFQAVKTSAKHSEEIEGKLIGGFRDAALKQTDNVPQPIEGTKAKLKELGEAFDFKIVPKVAQSVDSVKGMTSKTTMEIVPPSMGELKDLFPDATPSVLGRATSLLKDLQRTIDKHDGKLPLKEVDRLYKDFTKTINSFYGTKSGDQVAKKLIGMKDAVRDDWTATIGRTLQQFDPDALPGYVASMGKYSDIKVAQKTLKNVLKQSDLSASAFANQIFSPSQGKNRVAQLKTLISEHDPDLWNNLVDKQIQFMHNAAMNPKTGRMDWQKLSASFDKLDKSEILDQMVDPAKKRTMNQFFSLAKRVDSKFKFTEGKIGPKAIGLVRNLIVSSISSVSALARLGSAQNLTQATLEAVGKDKALVKWLNGEGLEMVLKGLPTKQASRIRTHVLPIISGVMKAKVAAPPSGKEPEQ